MAVPCRLNHVKNMLTIKNINDKKEEVLKTDLLKYVYVKGLTYLEPKFLLSVHLS